MEDIGAGLHGFFPAIWLLKISFDQTEWVLCVRDQIQERLDLERVNHNITVYDTI